MPIRTEKRLIPLLQLLLPKRIWQLPELPPELSEQPLKTLIGFQWIECRFYVPGYRVDWTTDVDVENWVRAAIAGMATLEIRVSRRGIERLDDLCLLKHEERERFKDVLNETKIAASPFSELAMGKRPLPQGNDKHVLHALARLGRGMIIELPRRPQDPEIADDKWEGEAEERLLDWVPDLFLWLEFYDSPIGKKRGASLIALERRGLIEVERKRLSIPAENCRYQTDAGSVWFLSTGAPFVCYPSHVSVPTYSVRRCTWVIDGMAMMKWYRLTPAGWELAGNLDDVIDLKEPRLDNRTRVQAPEGYEGYAPADTIRLDHGIPQSRLSERKKSGKIRSKIAPAGIKDSLGHTVRLYYHVADALAYCSPKHTNQRLRRKPRHIL